MRESVAISWASLEASRIVSLTSSSDNARLLVVRSSDLIGSRMLDTRDCDSAGAVMMFMEYSYVGIVNGATVADTCESC